MEEVPKFTVADYGVMCLMLCVSSGIGIYFAWHDRHDVSNKSFLLGNRKLGVFPVTMSLMASFQSATTVLGYPAEMYYKGTQFWMAIFGLAISNVIVAELLLPVLYKLNMTSVNTYLERRFSGAVRTLGSLSFITNTLLYMGVVLYGPSVALESVTGLPVWASILFLGLICTFYTVLGGMKAVVWTDTFQMTVMVLGLTTVVVLGVIKVGSLEKVWTTAEEGGRIQFLNTQLDTQSSVSLWNVLLGTTFIWLASYGTSQTQVQRFCSVPSLREAKMALYVNIPGVMLNISLGCVAGLVIYANYPDCDPLKSGKISKSDQLIPFFVMKTLSVVPGLPGLFVACVFSGALSTLSSGFNSLAAVTWEDFIRKWSHVSEKKAAIITRGVASAYGILTIGLAFLAGSIGSILKAAFAMSGALSGPLLGVFVLGMLLPSCNGKGALSGLLLGQVLCLWVVVGSLSSVPLNEDLPTSTAGCVRHDNATAHDLFGGVDAMDEIAVDRPKGIELLYRLSHLLVPVLGFVVTVFTSIVVSLFTGMNEGRLHDPELFTPCVSKRFTAPDDKEAGKSMVTVDGFNDPSIRDQPEVSISNVSKDRASTNL
ncbi:sodium-coupled monocarboxylate transporter 1-like isoform X2 [Dermacentor andersoni]|uniref:sodium-coupled monocarboxylate transporter 1-like isoform X2 n=1 Tax=Dermacentor andersoni TaxID=34620 RepID=UPI002154F8AD|nr:sodium-coupled monocarboxylate transporter 1-like isoform X2 [Dermacentor andersoni]